TKDGRLVPAGDAWIIRAFQVLVGQVVPGLPDIGKLDGEKKPFDTIIPVSHNGRLVVGGGALVATWYQRVSRSRREELMTLLTDDGAAVLQPVVRNLANELRAIAQPFATFLRLDLVGRDHQSHRLTFEIEFGGSHGFHHQDTAVFSV